MLETMTVLAPSRTSALPALVLASLLAASVASCGARSKRDMSVPSREVTYADACNLQSYFDERASAGLTSPQAADEMLATNSKSQTIGEGTYLLKDPMARQRFARLLRDEYDGLDRKLVQAVGSSEGRVSVHVRWWDSGPIRRLRPDDEVLVQTAAGALELPPNPCISDFLFGDKVYAMRARYLRNEVDLATDKPLGGAPGMPPPAPTASTTAAPSSAPIAAPTATSSAAATSVSPTSSSSAPTK